MSSAISFLCCRDCKKRTVGCHSKCEDYATAKENYQKIYDAREAERIRESLTDPKLQKYKRRPKIKYKGDITK